jgi:hypothetical protein
MIDVGFVLNIDPLSLSDKLHFFIFILIVMKFLGKI